MYLSWKEQTITDFSDQNIETLYDSGFVFTRINKGIMNQTRSIRIDLEKFNLSSENRRILRKTEDLKLEIYDIPYNNYHWSIHKTGKDFYENKFGPGVFSAQKIKELITDINKTNFNRLFVYSFDNKDVGYCVALETENTIHYSYPFYNLKLDISNLGLGMMIKVISLAKEKKKKYIYLGSAQRSSDTYKMQFSGFEWFDGENWQTDLVRLKDILK